ncbi:MAG: hypothetical protein K9M08_07850 [Pirellula sp.]|nr:hypothetical protein [Pirellula sp.]
MYNEDMDRQAETKVQVQEVEHEFRNSMNEKMTLEEYEVWEREQTERHEYGGVRSSRKLAAPVPIA